MEILALSQELRKGQIKYGLKFGMEIFRSQRPLAVVPRIKKLNDHAEPTKSNAKEMKIIKTALPD